jgi:hypothetical protein
MCPNVIDNEQVELPQWLLDVVDAMPAKIGRKDGAALVTKHVFPTSPKTVKSWPLPWECPNGRAVAPPAAYLAYALLKARKASSGNARWFRTTAQTAAGAIRT